MTLTRDHITRNRRSAEFVHLAAGTADTGARIGVASGDVVALAATDAKGRTSVVYLDPDLARTVGTALLMAARATERTP